jgi:hypothetical protein
MKKLLTSLLVMPALISFAANEEWANVPNAELTSTISSKKISATHVRGGTVLLQFREDGTLYGNHSSGGSDSGKWRIEESKLCMTWRRWDYEGCGLVQKKGNGYQHLYPNGSHHLTFRVN